METNTDLARSTSRELFEPHLDESAPELAEHRPVGHDVTDDVAVVCGTEHQPTARDQQDLDHQPTDEAPLRGRHDLAEEAQRA